MAVGNAELGGVLRTRLLAPRLPPNCLPRAALVERVVSGLEGRVVLIVAGAGYGKSVLAAQAAAQAPWPVAWCSCDERLDTPRLLLAHVVAAIAERIPGFGAGASVEGPQTPPSPPSATRSATPSPTTSFSSSTTCTR